MKLIIFLVLNQVCLQTIFCGKIVPSPKDAIENVLKITERFSDELRQLESKMHPFDKFDNDFLLFKDFGEQVNILNQISMDF